MPDSTDFVLLSSKVLSLSLWVGTRAGPLLLNSWLPTNLANYLRLLAAVFVGVFKFFDPEICAEEKFSTTLRFEDAV